MIKTLKKIMSRKFIVPVAIFLFGAFIGQNAMTALPQSLPDREELPSLAPMLERVTPAVVNIATEGRITVQQNPLFSDPFFRRFFNVPGPVERKTQSLGSGVIVDADRGLILTNNHVIENAVQITVTLRDGRQLQADLVGSDPETDVAVIRIPPDDLVDIKPADSDALRVGDFVVAIGNPFGLGQTVTSGIVSALSRSGLGIEGYEDFIQTDASINPGNSGGALVNLNGDLIGINTAIFSQSGGNIGTGFAIPINLSLHIMEQLVSTGEVDRGYIGISVQDMSPELAEALGVANPSGAIIVNVGKDSPAEIAGLQPGDVLASIDEKLVFNANDVRNHIGLLKVGEAVQFEFFREGRRLSLTVDVSSTRTYLTSRTIGNQRLGGITFNDIDKNSNYYGVVEGVAVEEIEQTSLAWQRGLRPGDVITSVNRLPVKNTKDFFDVLENYTGSLLLRIVRGNTAAFLVLR
jgi:Do/DeqQ family serine protease